MLSTHKSAAPQVQIAQGAVPSASDAFPDITREFAEHNGVKPQTVRKRYMTTGSYFGVRPLKLANRRLMWPHVFATKDTSLNASESGGA